MKINPIVYQSSELYGNWYLECNKEIHVQADDIAIWFSLEVEPQGNPFKEYVDLVRHEVIALGKDYSLRPDKIKELSKGNKMVWRLINGLDERFNSL